MQDLNPLELSCDADRDSDCQTNGNLTTDNDKLNPEATHLQQLQLLRRYRLLM